MYRYLLNCLVFLYFVDSSSGLDCSSFDASNITLITFDVFAALMDTSSSLTVSTAQILPRLSSDEVDTFVNTWLSDYGSYAGQIFDEDITGPQPFQWMLNTTLTQINVDMSLDLSQYEFESLIDAWGDLTPWPGTTATLGKMAAANFTLAPLSNGDSGTLATAMKVFNPMVTFGFIFSSDFPNAGSFKPDYRMYAQVPKLSEINPLNYLHVAGAPSDARGAREYGIYSALVYNHPIPGQYYPCFVLNNITDLLNIFGI